MAEWWLGSTTSDQCGQNPGGDHSLRQTYNSEMDIVDVADATSDHEQDEEELYEEDD